MSTDNVGSINNQAFDLGTDQFRRPQVVLTDSSGNPLGSGGALTRVAQEMTRVADTNAYAAGDVVSNDVTTTAFNTLANFARLAGGNGYIVGCRVVTNLKSITPRLRVNVWNAVGGTIAGDNVAAKSVYADLSKRIAAIDLPPLVTLADTSGSDESKASDFSLRIPYSAVARDVYFTLETLDAFTPASGQKFTVELFGDNN